MDADRSRLPEHTPRRVRVDARAIADARQGVVEPGSVLYEVVAGGARVLASGSPVEVDAADVPPPDRVVSCPDRLILPALVNAHTHLDLTHIGPQAHDPGVGFVAWVDRIRDARRSDPDAIAESVREGIALSLAGGSGAVGDIAGAPGGRPTDIPTRTLAGSQLGGVSYLEFFGIGRSAASTADTLARFARDRLEGLLGSLRGTGVGFGLQPHAPNTVDLGVYGWAAELARTRGLAFCTHLAETPEERRFVATGTGTQRELLERFGLWDDSVLDHLGKGRHPVAHLEPVLERIRTLCAHVNDATDAAIDVLARTRAAVVYCPRASSYFGAAAHFGPHRYRAMIDAGITVCLGTDSIVNLDTHDRISVLDEMRLLHRRDGTPARELLTMATTAGCAALGLDPSRFTLGRGPIAGLLSVDAGPCRAGGTLGRDGSVGAWEGAMDSDAPPAWIVAPKRPGPTSSDVRP